MGAQDGQEGTLWFEAGRARMNDIWKSEFIGKKRVVLRPGISETSLEIVKYIVGETEAGRGDWRCFWLISSRNDVALTLGQCSFMVLKFWNHTPLVLKVVLEIIFHPKAEQAEKWEN